MVTVPRLHVWRLTVNAPNLFATSTYEAMFLLELDATWSGLRLSYSIPDAPAHSSKRSFMIQLAPWMSWTKVENVTCSSPDEVRPLTTGCSF